MTTHSLITFFVAMVAILNPLGNAVIYLGMMKGQSDQVRHRTVVSCVIAVIVILLLSAWAGIWVLKAFGITIGAFEVAGGVLILMAGLTMVRGEPQNDERYIDQPQHCQPASVAIIPLALPLVAGPGAISTVIIYCNGLPGLMNRIAISVICIVVALGIGVLFKLAPWFGKLLREEGQKVVSRIMGLILMAIAFQMTANGLGDLFPVIH